jgi:8-amino-7-oxononanoate synthase
VRDRLAELRGSYRHCLVATESYFSMDGDSPDLAALRGACDAFDAALYVDEAHALGVFGAEGRGVSSVQGVQPDVLVGTLGKAIGLQGAFIAGDATLRQWLWNRSRSLVFSTALSPALAADVPSRIEQVRAAEERRDRLHHVAARLRATLAEHRAASRDGTGPILPWVLGPPARALEASEALRGFGVLGMAIRPPTVPQGTARLRLAVSAGLGNDAVEQACDAIHQVARRFER